MEARKIRVILDTNLWISFLISKKSGLIYQLLESEKLLLIFSEESKNEFLEVARRPKFVKYFPAQLIEALMEMFDIYGELVQVVSVVDACRDAKDNFLLALAKDSQADFLVTGDADLLIIKTFEHTEIITYAEFELRNLQ